MKILIIGGAGFYGSHVVEAFLAHGYDVTVVDFLSHGNKIPAQILDNVDFHERDAREPGLLKKLAHGADGIVNLASVVGVDNVISNSTKQMDNEVNIVRAVFEASTANNKCPVLYASSSSVYGSMNQGLAASENMPIAGSSSYSIAKAWGEKYAKCQAESENISVTVIRPFNLYGPRQDNRMVIPRFIEASLAGRNLKVYGDGMQTRDFTYVKDGAEAIVNLLTRMGKDKSPERFSVLNVSTGQEGTIKALAEHIIELTGTASKLEFQKLPLERYDYEVNRRFGDPTQFLAATELKHLTTLKEGIQHILSSM